MDITKLIDEDMMPAPRLELRWSRFKGWAQRRCYYNLVLPLQEHDIRREDKDGNQVRSVLTVNIGMTESTGSYESPLDERHQFIPTPFRDGAHAGWDAKVLGGLPVFAVADGKARLVPPIH